ncbi:MAG: flippase [Candidatus Aenigmatarchaeota archaeon]|nr:MAG: flippase [Candidatus Aenigmarchaeota archaeon]
MTLAKRVFRNSIFHVSSSFIDKVGALVFSIILARLLQPELFGTYYLALSIGFLFAAFTDIGVGETMIRWVSNALGKKNGSLARSYYRYLLKIKLLLMCITSSIMFFASYFIANVIFSEPSLLLPLQIVAAYISLYSFFSFLHLTSVSIQVFKYGVIGKGIYEISRIVFVPLLIIWGLSINGAILGICLALILTIVIMLYILTKNYGFLFRGGIIPIKKRKILKFLSFLSISSISFMFFINIDSVMLGFFLPNEYVGFYKIASAIIFSFVGLISITYVLFPVFSQLESSRLENVFNVAFRYSAILSIPTIFMLIWVAEPLIKVIYGHEYLQAVLPLSILSFLIIESLLGSFFTTILTARKLPQYPAKIMVVSTILNVIINFFLIQLFGILGAAVATVITRYFYSISLGIIVKLKLDISPHFASIWKPLISSFLMLGFLFLLPKPHDIFLGIGEVLGAAVFYFVILYLIRGIGVDDWRYIKKILKS